MDIISFLSYIYKLAGPKAGLYAEALIKKSAQTLLDGW
jgi:hypothetical protein